MRAVLTVTIHRSPRKTVRNHFEVEPLSELSESVLEVIDEVGGILEPD